MPSPFPTPPAERLIEAARARPGDDPIFALNAEATARAARGERVINATLGALMDDEGRLAVMPSVREALERVDPRLAASYAPIAGDPRFLREVIGDVLGESPLAEMAVAVATPGGTGAVHHAIVNFLEPGQALLTTSYSWAPYGILANHTGRRLETFPMFDAGGQLDLDSLEEALQRQMGAQGRALVVLNTPCHNPTGYTMDAGELAGAGEILRRAARRGPVAVLFDLAYARFGRDGGRGFARAVEAIAGEVLVLAAWTVSKAFAQYGARVGALLAVTPEAAERRRIGDALSYSCRGTWSNCNHLGMLAVRDLLSDPGLRERCESERRALIALLDERVRVFNRLAAPAGLRHPRYEGGFFVTVFTPDALERARRMRAAGVFVVPMEGALRVALCSTPARDVPDLVGALAGA
jgi:aromatic-amino-acid transaminase